jgi:hypothetical protein
MHPRCFTFDRRVSKSERPLGALSALFDSALGIISTGFSCPTTWHILASRGWSDGIFLSASVNRALAEGCCDDALREAIDGCHWRRSGDNTAGDQAVAWHLSRACVAQRSFVIRSVRTRLSGSTWRPRLRSPTARRRPRGCAERRRQLLGAWRAGSDHDAPLNYPVWLLAPSNAGGVGRGLLRGTYS